MCDMYIEAYFSPKYTYKRDKVGLPVRDTSWKTLNGKGTRWLISGSIPVETYWYRERVRSVKWIRLTVFRDMTMIHRYWFTWKICGSYGKILSQKSRSLLNDLRILIDSLLTLTEWQLWWTKHFSEAYH